MSVTGEVEGWHKNTGRVRLRVPRHHVQGVLDEMCEESSYRTQLPKRARPCPTGPARGWRRVETIVECYQHPDQGQLREAVACPQMGNHFLCYRLMHRRSKKLGHSKEPR